MQLELVTHSGLEREEEREEKREKDSAAIIRFDIDMATETLTDAVNGQMEEQVSSSAADGVVELVSAAACDLPLPAVKELLSIRVCTHCIFRFFGVPECVYSSDILSVPVLSSTLKKVVDAKFGSANNGLTIEEDTNSKCSGEEAELERNLCRICLGILQFSYQDDKQMLQTKVSANEYAASIVESVKKEGHSFDSFSLEVSIPTSIAENEQAIWSHIQQKYSSELWFRENSMPTRISVKDVLKLLITSPLENLLEAKSGSSTPFRIRLTYTNSVSSTNTQNSEETETNKRRKTGTDESGASNGCVVAGKENGSLKCNNGSPNNDSLNLPYFLLEKVSQPCSLSVSCSRNAVYIGGRYLKYSRNVSQTRWVIDDERVGEASVEEIIGSNILPACGGDNYKFHAAGREDIDVRMLGSGRPFLIEIQNARHIPSEASIKAVEEKINSLENKLVGVKNVKEMGSQGWDLMREGESEKQKQYAAVVWISRALEDDDLNNLSSFNDMRILQKTPIRVLHRRSPLEREKIIHWMKIEKICGSRQYFLLHLCTQAGTYIKEFVHGDLGRTHPSIGSILGCRAEILQLDVTDVKMDCFLSE